MLVAITLIGLSQRQVSAQLSPAPDGCYPNFTTAEGVMPSLDSAPVQEIQALVGSAL